MACNLYYRVAVRSFKGGGSIGALRGQLWLRLEEAHNDDSHADCLLHQMRGGGGVAGRMGTERGETVRTLDKAPWVRTDHHSGRYVRFETAESGAGGEGSPFSSLVCFSWRSTIKHVRRAVRLGPGGTQPDQRLGTAPGSSRRWSVGVVDTGHWGSATFKQGGLQEGK